MFEHLFESGVGSSWSSVRALSQTRNRGRVLGTTSAVGAASTPVPTADVGSQVRKSSKVTTSKVTTSKVTNSLVVAVAEGGAPVRFRWRGRRYVVCAVLAHWVEALPWWVGWGRSGRHVLLVQRHVWRVEARTGSSDAGVYDLFQVIRGDESRWSMGRVID